MRLSDYLISPREFGVLLELLESAASAGTLTEDQLARLSYDSMDMIIDLKGKAIVGVLVSYEEEV